MLAESLGAHLAQTWGCMETPVPPLTSVPSIPYAALAPLVLENSLLLRPSGIIVTVRFKQ